MLRFQRETLPQRVYFASGEARPLLARAVQALGAARVMVIASPREAPRAAALTADVPVVHRHDEVVMHVPVAVAERARAAAARRGADVLVSVGGGSAIGLAKAVALDTGLPIVAVPTTYAGSEATDVWGLTDEGRKRTGAHAAVLPRAIVYDAELTLSLPAAESVASGLNALAHCVDAMWGPRVDPIDRALAQEGIRALRTGLPQVATDPTGLPGRESTLYGAYLAATAFASAGAGLHHKICHVLGGAHHLPHAQTHAIVLPYVLAFNAPAAPEAEQRIAAALDAAGAVDGLQRLKSDLAAPTALRDYGFDERDIDTAVTAILPALPSGNPRPVDAYHLRGLLTAAWRGSDPHDITTGTERQS